MESNLFSRVRTIDERALCLQSLDQFIASLFSSKEISGDIFSPFFKQITDTSENKKKTLEDVRSQLLQAKVVKISLVFVPDEAFITQLSNALRAKPGYEHAIVDIQEDPSVIGGMVLSDGGKRMDHSLLQKIASLEMQKILAVHLPSIGTP